MKIKKILGVAYLVAVFLALYFFSPLLASAVPGIALAGIMINGPYGSFTGKVGGTIAANWKGINYLKAYVVPANPRTPAQQDQRSKFKVAIALAQSLIPTLITQFWNPFAVGMSGFNAFVRNIFPSLTSNGLVTASTQVTKGTLETPGTHNATYNASTGQIISNYSNSTSGNGLATDNIGMLVLSATNNSILGYADSKSPRSAGQASMLIQSGLSPANVIVYVFAWRADGNVLTVSNSVGAVCTAA